MTTTLLALEEETEKRIGMISPLGFSAGDYVVMNSQSLVCIQAIIFGRFYVSSRLGSVTKYHYVRGFELRQLTDIRVTVNIPEWFTGWSSLSNNQRKNRLIKADRVSEIIWARRIDEYFDGVMSMFLNLPESNEIFLIFNIDDQIGRVIDTLVEATRRLEQQIRDETVHLLEAYTNERGLYADVLIARMDEDFNEYVTQLVVEEVVNDILAYGVRLGELVQEGVARDLMRMVYPQAAFHLMTNAERISFIQTGDDDLLGVICQVCFSAVDVLDPQVSTVMCCGGQPLCGGCRGEYIAFHGNSHPIQFSNTEHIRQALVSSRDAFNR
jgi:hypothetical protein